MQSAINILLLNSIYILQTTFLSALFLTALGFVLVVLGFDIQQLEGFDIPVALTLEFSGALLAGFFWVSQCGPQGAT